MKYFIITCCLLVGTPAWATTITYEPGSDRVGWSDVYPMHSGLWQGDYGNDGIAFPSGDVAAVNPFGTNTLALYGPISLVAGVWVAPMTAFNGWYDPYSVHALTVEGYAGGELVGSTTWELAPGFQYFETGFIDPVDKLLFLTGATSPQWYLFDDLTLTVLEQPSVVREPSPENVPEPAIWLLLGVGLLLVILASLIVTQAEARLEADHLVE